MTLNHTICYQALKARDARFDGRFYTAVSSTGIFCRPICPATTPKAENCTFYPTASAALQAGYRPCLRCRPESAPASPAWMGTETTVRRAITLIEEGALDDGQTLESLCTRLGVGERHLRRLFQTHLGTSPKQMAQTRRLLFAKRLLKQTATPITDIAFAAGFSSLRRFNDAYKSAFGFAPREERKNRDDIATSENITLKFNYRPPYDWDGLLAFFALRAIAPVERVEEGYYIRKVRFEGQDGEIMISNDYANNRLVCQFFNIETRHLRDITHKIRRLFDLDADPQAIAQALSKDDILRPLIKATPGLRLPGAWDGFEIALRAIIGQQISVKGARTICMRVLERIGTGLFPTPQDILEHNLDGLGLTGRRIATLKKLAENWAELDAAKPVEETIKDLCALPGIGPWTAHYMMMRAFGEPDIYPVADLGLIRALESQGIVDAKTELENRSKNWRPWRAYGAIYLWNLHS